MLLLLNIALLLIMTTIAFEDLRSRLVHFIWFPVLIVISIMARLIAGTSWQVLVEQIFINACTILAACCSVTLYILVRLRRWAAIKEAFPGGADVWLWIALAIYLPVLNYVLFFFGSLLIALTVWLAIRALSNKKNDLIPLAGLQAILFALYLTISWCLPGIRPDSEEWLLAYLI